MPKQNEVSLLQDFPLPKLQEEQLINMNVKQQNLRTLNIFKINEK